MRITIRLNEKELAKLKLFQALTGIDEPSTALKFALEWSLNHIENVTESLITPNWEVIFRRVSKSNPSKKRMYF